MTDLKCYCGLYHYNLAQYTKVHSSNQKIIDPWIQVAFANDQIWNPKEHDYIQPLPLITRKWTCQFCQNYQGNHNQDCSFLLTNQA